MDIGRPSISWLREQARQVERRLTTAGEAERGDLSAELTSWQDEIASRVEEDRNPRGPFASLQVATC